jgi:Ca-activated chloride channel family protein
LRKPPADGTNLWDNRAEGLEAIYREKLSLVPKHELAERMQKVPIERFQWPLMAALILLLAEFAISDRKWRRKPFPGIKSAYRRMPKLGRAAGAVSLGVLLLLAIVLLGFRGAHASPGSAEAAYKAGNYDLAIQGYRSEIKEAPENPQLQFNLGAAAYKDKKYPEALASFEKSLKVQDIPLQNQSYYNMGNTLYRQGEQTEKQNPQQTIQHWEASIKAYENALKLKPDDQDAEFNRDFVKKRLEALKKKQNKKDCDKCNNKNNKDQNKKNKDQDKNNQQANNKGSKQDQKKNQKNNNLDRKSGQDQKQNSKKKDNQQKNQQNQTAKTDQQKKNPDQKNRQQAKGDVDKDKKKPSDRPQKGNGQAKKDRGKPSQRDQQPAAQAARKRRPGQMSQEQAKRLLDSLKGDEKAMPLTAQNMGAAGKPQDRERRDW